MRCEIVHLCLYKSSSWRVVHVSSINQRSSLNSASASIIFICSAVSNIYIYIYIYIYIFIYLFIYLFIFLFIYLTFDDVVTFCAMQDAGSKSLQSDYLRNFVYERFSGLLGFINSFLNRTIVLFTRRGLCFLCLEELLHTV